MATRGVWDAKFRVRVPALRPICFSLTTSQASLAHQVERLFCTQKARGSSPLAGSRCAAL